MKPFHENDLIAYHLQDLSPRRARALEQALKTNSSLAAEFEAYAVMLRSFKSVFPLDVEEETIERNWKQLWQRLPVATLKPVLFPRWRLAAIAGVAFAVAVTMYFVLPRRQPASSTNTFHVSNSTSSSVLQGEVSPTDTLPRFSQFQSRSPHTTADHIPAVSSLTPRNVAPSRIHAPVATTDDQPVLQFIPLSRANNLVPSTPAMPRITPLPAGPEHDSAAGRSSQSSGSNLHHNIARREHPTDITLAMGGTLIGARTFTSNGATYSQDATHAVSAIASFHQQLRPAIGYRATVSYARPDFHYDAASGRTSINGRIYEVAGTWVFQGPHRGIVRTSLEGGAGFMSILPTVSSTTTSKNLRAAAIVGINAEFAVSRHVAVQTGYRMQIFKGPDFNTTGNIVPTTLISQEPMVGITYRFSHQ